MGRSIHRRSLAWDLMRAKGYGAVLVSLFVATNIGQALKPFLGGTSSKRRDWERKRVREALTRLRKRRYVRFEQKGSEVHIVVTEYGRQRLRKFEFDTVAPPPEPRRWDHRWRIVAFDIPETKKRQRVIFRDKLRELGFLAFQKSVCVYPYPCEDEIDFLTQFLNINRYVRYIEAHALGTAEGKARLHFGLL